jgi:hypothetical protein
MSISLALDNHRSGHGSVGTCPTHSSFFQLLLHEDFHGIRLPVLVAETSGELSESKQICARLDPWNAIVVGIAIVIAGLEELL